MLVHSAAAKIVMAAVKISLADLCSSDVHHCFASAHGAKSFWASSSCNICIIRCGATTSVQQFIYASTRRTMVQNLSATGVKVLWSLCVEKHLALLSKVGASGKLVEIPVPAYKWSQSTGHIHVSHTHHCSIAVHLSGQVRWHLAVRCCLCILNQGSSHPDRVLLFHARCPLHLNWYPRRLVPMAPALPLFYLGQVLTFNVQHAAAGMLRI